MFQSGWYDKQKSRQVKNVKENIEQIGNVPSVGEATLDNKDAQELLGLTKENANNINHFILGEKNKMGMHLESGEQKEVQKSVMRIETAESILGFKEAEQKYNAVKEMGVVINKHQNDGELGIDRVFEEEKVAQKRRLVFYDNLRSDKLTVVENKLALFGKEGNKESELRHIKNKEAQTFKGEENAIKQFNGYLPTEKFAKGVAVIKNANNSYSLNQFEHRIEKATEIVDQFQNNKNKTFVDTRSVKQQSHEFNNAAAFKGFEEPKKPSEVEEIESDMSIVNQLLEGSNGNKKALTTLKKYAQEKINHIDQLSKTYDPRTKKMLERTWEGKQKKYAKDLQMLHEKGEGDLGFADSLGVTNELNHVKEKLPAKQEEKVSDNAAAFK